MYGFINDDYVTFKYNLIVRRNQNYVLNRFYQEDQEELAHEEFKSEVHSYVGLEGYYIELIDLDTSNVIDYYDSDAELC